MINMAQMNNNNTHRSNKRKPLRRQRVETRAIPGIELTLSRDSYRCGQTVCGSVCLLPSSGPFDSLQVFISGYVRLSTRWHSVDTEQLKRLYGKRHPLLVNLQPEDLLDETYGHKDSDVCFFATNCLSLLPKSSTRIHSETKHIGQSRNLDNKNCHAFQALIPDDLPYSVNGICCRYFYSCCAVACMTTGERISFHLPFTILSRGKKSLVADVQHFGIGGMHLTSGRVKFGTMSSDAALSDNVPIAVYHQRQQIMSDMNGGNERMIGSQDVISLRVTNAIENPVCILNITSESRFLVTPGSRTHLKFQFDPTSSARDEDYSFVFCRRVCACFFVEENVCNDGNLEVVKTYVHNAQHKHVDDDIISLEISLLLPESSPCSIRTDLIEINTKLKVELTVDNVHDNLKNRVKYEVLRMEIPFTVVHAIEIPEESASFTVNNNSWDGQELQHDLSVLSAKLKERHDNGV